MDTLPHVILTSNKEWDLTTLDQDVTAEEITPDKDKDNPFQDALTTTLETGSLIVPVGTDIERFR